MSEELDTSWIEHQEKEESKYDGFYKESLTSLNTYCIYVNKDNNIEHIKKDRMILSENNIIPKEELLFQIKSNTNYSNIKYGLKTVLVYNIDFEPENIEHFMENPESFKFLKMITMIKDTKLNDTIATFHDLNSLYLIFYERKPTTKHTTTKRIHLKNTPNRHTRRKSYKERT